MCNTGSKKPRVNPCLPPSLPPSPLDAKNRSNFSLTLSRDQINGLLPWTDLFHPGPRARWWISLASPWLTAAILFASRPAAYLPTPPFFAPFEAARDFFWLLVYASFCSSSSSLLHPLPWEYYISRVRLASFFAAPLASLSRNPPSTRWVIHFFSTYYTIQFTRWANVSGLVRLDPKKNGENFLFDLPSTELWPLGYQDWNVKTVRGKNKRVIIVLAGSNQVCFQPRRR